MPELTPELAAKLDGDLQRLWASGALDAEARIPVVLRCSPGQADVVSSAIARSGGQVRHQFTLLPALSAWMPLRAIPDLAARPDISSVEMEHEFTLARR